MSTSEDKQLNYYSELLRTPYERATGEQSMLSNSSFLSIKMINKKQVIARMNKFKADLYLLLNIVDSALINYSHAYSQGKKETENAVWAMSALEGLCVASYIYLTETKQIVPGAAAANSNTTATTTSATTTTNVNGHLAVPNSSNSSSSSSTLNRSGQSDLSHSCK